MIDRNQLKFSALGIFSLIVSMFLLIGNYLPKFQSIFLVAIVIGLFLAFAPLWVFVVSLIDEYSAELKYSLGVTMPVSFFLIFFVSVVLMYLGLHVAYNTEQSWLRTFFLLLTYARALVYVPAATGYFAMRLSTEFKVAFLAGFIHGLTLGLILHFLISIFLIPSGLDFTFFLQSLLTLPVFSAIVSGLVGFGGAWLVGSNIGTKPDPATKLKVMTAITFLGVASFFGVAGSILGVALILAMVLIFALIILKVISKY